jgi:hypothetical protein
LTAPIARAAKTALATDVAQYGTTSRQKSDRCRRPQVHVRFSQYPGMMPATDAATEEDFAPSRWGVEQHDEGDF